MLVFLFHLWGVSGCCWNSWTGTTGEQRGKGEWFGLDGTLKTYLFQPLPWKGKGKFHRTQLKLGRNPIFPELQQSLYHTLVFSSTLIKLFFQNSSSTLPCAHYQILISCATEGSRECSPGLWRQRWAELREQPHRTSHSCTSVVTTADKVITPTPLETGNLKSTGLHCWECCWLRVNYQILNSHGREPPANSSTTNLLH